ncbi:Uncharacterised protein [Raoultella terrigena]|uniref:Uncharacterized protein n=1 Tax=Raoultella terrigena TaxID=577 RepID=A0A4U9DC82_RAOTE|nr:Uncharacterised protein [Raoultella terrigena]
MISDRPEEARWLPEKERDYLVTTLAAERAAKLAEDAVSNAPVKDVFRNSGLMKLVILNFSTRPAITATPCGCRPFLKG